MMYKKQLEELCKIALRYVEKGYSYEALKCGDDLYSATPEEKETCLQYYDDIIEHGTYWAYDKLEEL